MTDFLRSVVKNMKSDYVTILDDELGAGEFSGYIDTGSYALNALFSGTIYGGMPNNRITGLAGETSTGKTFFALGIVDQFLAADPGAGVFYFDSEGAIRKKMLTDRGTDPSRVVLIEPGTIQDFRTRAIKIIEMYEQTPKAERTPIAFVLDSLGMLSTNKEVSDITEGSDTRDMTRSQLVRGAFRTLTLRAAKANIPFIVTNHTYAVIGAYVPTQEMAGGGGLKYAASSIYFLSKKKFKDGDEVTGNVIRVRQVKGRLTRENAEVHVLLSYETGLDRYYGLLEIAEEYKIVTKTAGKFVFPDGTKAFEKSINRSPEKYFSKELLDKIDLACREKFMYGSALELATETDEEIAAEAESEAED